MSAERTRSALSAPPPTVSIVVATYDRSQVLRHAIASVLASDFADWELIVVGDACTDDTGETVAAFADSRIRFVNLPRNCGEQSGPNNEGIALARGRYLAFLNHDDLHLPDHLGAAVAALDRGEAEMVVAGAAVAENVGPRRPGQPPLAFTVLGVPPPHGYSPFGFYNASTWVLRRELAARVGPWPAAATVYVTPSQAWLFRIWRSGARLDFPPRLGAVLLLSGTRRDSYAQRTSPDHEALAAWMRDEPRWRERLLEDAAVRAAGETLHHRYHSPARALARAAATPLWRLLTRLGVHPVSLGNLLRYGRRGGFIRFHARLTGVRTARGATAAR